MVAAVNAVRIILPDLELAYEEGYVTIWALADSGSAAHVADINKSFPGAILRRSEGRNRGLKYATADGGEIKHGGLT